MFRDKPQYASMVPFHDITRDRAEQRSLFAETGELADRLVGQRRRLFARPLDPHQGDEGRLARGSIILQRLARPRLVAFDVQHFAGDLKGEPDGASSEDRRDGEELVSML